jgi:hypothetical protein
MPDLNERFRADAHLFARTRALYPWPSPSLALNHSHFKSLALEEENELELTQVQGDNKVCYGTISPALGLRGLVGDYMNDYSRDVGLYVMQITNDPLTDTSFPVYYLPYALDGSLRIKLKPSRKHARLGTGGAVLDPDVFVTVALQGCSIFVDGSTTEPVVYHMNATSFGGSAADETTAEGALRVVAAKEEEMRRRHALARARYTKEGPSAGGHAPPRDTRHAEARMSEYMPEGITSGGRTALATRHSRSWRTLWGWAGGWNASASQVATVFGVRTAGHWAFYRQTRVRVMYDVLVPGEAPYAPPVREREIVWAGVNCVRFWPA